MAGGTAVAPQEDVAMAVEETKASSSAEMEVEEVAEVDPIVAALAAAKALTPSAVLAEGEKSEKSDKAPQTSVQEDGDAEAAMAAYAAIVTGFPERSQDEAGTRAKEEALYALARLYARAGRAPEMVGLLETASPLFAAIAKAKTAKIVRGILDIAATASQSSSSSSSSSGTTTATSSSSLDAQAELCHRVIQWCRTEKRTFLRQRVESRLAVVDYERGFYDEALKLVTQLLKELKKLDDKQMLVETHLTEAKIHGALRNVPKAKAALTAARTNGNAVYVGPSLQAQLDEMSGALHCEESDYSTAYSYFLEAFEGFDSLDDQVRAAKCLKYMVLCQILDEEDATSKSSSSKKPRGAGKKALAQLASKHEIKYAGDDLDSMAAVAKAAKDRSLDAFEIATSKFADTLNKDLLVKHHLSQLYDHILERNLAKIIEPFSRCEIAQIAKLINLSPAKVEHKLAQMILDKKINATLAQGAGHLIVHEAASEDPTYAASLDVIKNMEDVVESLFRRAEALDA